MQKKEIRQWDNRTKDGSTLKNQSMWYITLSKWKGNKHVIISIDAEKNRQNQTHFRDKNTWKLGIEGNYFKITKAIH